MGNMSILTGLIIPNQNALDSKAICISEATLKNLGTENNLAYTYYDGLQVVCQLEKSVWEWREALVGEIGLLTSNFIYPNNIIVNGITYSLKPYNFFIPKNLQFNNNVANATIQVGGISPNTVLANKTVKEILIQMLVVYQNPQFTLFSMSQASLIEVGETLSGTKTFTWSTNNNGNINTNSLLIRDVTANTVLGSGLANDGTETLNIGTITNTAPITRNWRIEGVNTNSIGFNSNNYAVNSIYPIFYSVSNTPPVANQALINSGLKQVVPSDGTLNITFGAVGQYLWFAHPASMPTKTKWYVNALNNGNIGTISDLFNAPTTVNITTALWNGISYKIYISNNPTTTTGTMELKNS